MYGVYQHVSEAYSHRYLVAFDFRYSNREKLDSARASRPLAGARGAGLPMKELIERRAKNERYVRYRKRHWRLWAIRDNCLYHFLATSMEVSPCHERLKNRMIQSNRNDSSKPLKKSAQMTRKLWSAHSTRWLLFTTNQSRHVSFFTSL
jgi:hypothetical protein